jgi:hypothetical protein
MNPSLPPERLVRGTHSAAEDSVRESPSHLQADAVGKPFHPQPRTGSFAVGATKSEATPIDILKETVHSSTRGGTFVSSRWARCHVTAAAGPRTTHILCRSSDAVYVFEN